MTPKATLLPDVDSRPGSDPSSCAAPKGRSPKTCPIALKKTSFARSRGSRRRFIVLNSNALTTAAQNQNPAGIGSKPISFFDLLAPLAPDLLRSPLAQLSGHRA